MSWTVSILMDVIDAGKEYNVAFETETDVNPCQIFQFSKSYSQSATTLTRGLACIKVYIIDKNKKIVSNLMLTKDRVGGELYIEHMKKNLKIF